MNALIDSAKISCEMLRLVQTVETRKREARAYCGRMAALQSERNIFAQCKQGRTKKRYRNSASSEAAGRIGLQLTTKRFNNSHITVACKTRIY